MIVAVNEFVKRQTKFSGKTFSEELSFDFFAKHAEQKIINKDFRQGYRPEVIVVKLDIESQLGGGNPEDWHYGIVMMSQDGYGPNGSRIREINPSSEQYRGGGAPNVVNHPNIFDVIFPDEGVQEDYLSSYGDYEGSVDDIPTDKLASIPLVTKNS